MEEIVGLYVEAEAYVKLYISGLSKGDTDGGFRERIVRKRTRAEAMKRLLEIAGSLKSKISLSSSSRVGQPVSASDINRSLGRPDIEKMVDEEFAEKECYGRAIDAAAIHRGAGSQIQISYKDFLSGMLNNTLAFKSIYEEFECKKLLCGYLKEYSRRRHPERNHRRFVRWIETHGRMHAANEPRKLFRSASYCMACRREIRNKMVKYHVRSKRHVGGPERIIKISGKEASRVHGEYLKLVEVFATEIREAVHMEGRELGEKEARNTPRNAPSEEETPRWAIRKYALDVKYKCGICVREFIGRREFVKHFFEEPHASHLKAVGIDNFKDYVGITTYERVEKMKLISE